MNSRPIAAAMRPLVEQVDGFLSVERFQSLTDEGKILSLSFFRDEEAIHQWRNLEAHRAAQASDRLIDYIEEFTRKSLDVAVSFD